MKIQNNIKRFLDILISTGIVITLWPVLVLSALMILIFEGFPILYISQRMISPVKEIKIFKFRTMVRNATSPKYQLVERYMRDGYLDIPLECEVYTPIGRILEKTQIVEILQIKNILKGELSFVGNRPLPIGNIEQLEKFPGYEKRFDSPCGITGIAQIAGKYNLLAQQRIELEIKYSSIYNNKNGKIILCDALIILHTIKLLFTGKYLGYAKSIALLTRCGAN